MRYFLIILKLVLAIGCFGQSGRDIQFSVNPVLFELGNLETRNTEQRCETVFTNFRTYPSFELAAFYHSTINEKWAFAIGLSYRKAKFENSFNFTLYNNPENVPISYSSISSVDYGLLKLRLDYLVSNRFEVNALINFELPFLEKNSNNDNLYSSFYASNAVWNGTTYESVPVQENDVRIINSGYQSTGNIVPEFGVSYTFLPQFSMYAGMRFKLWKSPQPIIEATVDGFTGPENNTKYERIFHATVDNRELSLLVGLRYNLKLNSRTP